MTPAVAAAPAEAPPTLRQRATDAVRAAAHLSHEARLIRSIASDAAEDGMHAAKRTYKMAVRRVGMRPMRQPWRHQMATQDGEIYPFTFEAVREKAPSASGVYTIHTAQRWVYVGESADIRQSLFQHLNEPGASMHRFGPLSFSFELAPEAERKALQQTLIAELEPECRGEQTAEAHPRA